MSKYFQSIKQASKENLPWEKFSGKNILVTGATGLIGSCVVDILMNRENKDYKVYALGRNEERAHERFCNYWEDSSFSFIKADLTELPATEIPFHFVVNAASGANPMEYSMNPVGVMKSNLIGSFHLFDYGIKHGLEKYLYVSSGEVYGQGDEDMFDEQYSGYIDWLSPRACYPSSKRAAETLCAAYAQQYQIAFNVVRPCHVYGPTFTESDNRAYAQFLRTASNGQNIVMKSTGEQMRSWCYVVDCARAILYVLLAGKSGEAYNIASPQTICSIREFAMTIAKLSGKEVVFELPSDVEKRGYSQIKHAVFDTNKLQGIGWKAVYNLEDSLRESLDYLKGKEA